MAQASKKPLTKSQFLEAVAEECGVGKKDCSKVLEGITSVIEKQLKPNGAGKVNLPGLLKIEVKKVPARKAKKGVPNPFKPGELMDIAAKPASKKVKVRPLKALKDMA